MVTLSNVQKRKTAFDLKVWLMEPRPHYLVLPVVLIWIGTASAWYYTGQVSTGHALLALFGLVFCHMSVNMLNDYFDFRSGIDLKTTKTPFNGGSGILPAGKLRPGQVLWYSLICLFLAVPVGIYFSLVQGWQLLPLLLVGVLCVLFYTSFILKKHFPEWSPGVGLGLLPVLGAYFVQTGGYSFSAFMASVPSGFLVLNLLLLNEFPDRDADLIASRKTLPITVGKKKAAVIYTSFTAATYLWIVGAVITHQMPLCCLLALLTLPLAYKAVQGAFSDQRTEAIFSAMSSNVLVVILTQALLGLGFIMAGVLQQ
ncbi:MAG: prenyltransferase [Dehalococcoidales bacterium]|nr:prenyltransferase [Dehalococcoidales bacterium]